MKQEYIYNLTLPDLIIFSEKEGYTKGNALALWKNLYRNKVESWAECVNVNEKYERITETGQHITGKRFQLVAWQI